MGDDVREIAKTIYEQLGGIGALKMMLGASNFSYSEKDYSITFRFKMCRKANYLTVALNSMDLYTMTFAKASLKRGYTVAKTFENVYAEDLLRIFRDYTGLETRIPRVVGIND